METPWEEASERTKRRYLRKGKQAVNAVLNEMAPNQSTNLWRSLTTTKPFNQSSSDDDEANESECTDPVLMDALAECYNNANSWGTKRQMLSIMADKVAFKTLKCWIPDLSRYRYSCAIKHFLVHGRGVPPPQSTRTRMAVSKTQLDHFLDFITSPHVIQDLPFGEKSVKLSTKEVITVPNVIRLMIPESIVKQYTAYAEESGFAPMSRRTLLRILTSCPASVQKSLQGLDYLSAEGGQAFDDLCYVVDKLGDCGYKGMTWAKEQRAQLTSAKRYLKSDYKVCKFSLSRRRSFMHITDLLCCS